MERFRALTTGRSPTPRRRLYFFSMYYFFGVYVVYGIEAWLASL